jgi:hypothetical protein
VRGRGIPAGRSDAALPPAGYEPTQLDTTIRSHIAACEKAVRIAESLGPKVEEAVNQIVNGQMAGTPEVKADLLSKLHERLSKATLNLVKSTDELSRLRSFLAGGPDSRPDLSARGERELRVLLFKAILQLGWRVIDDKGQVIDAEVVA